MEDVDIWETYLSPRGLYYRYAAEVFLQCWYYGTNNFNISLDDTGLAQGGRVQD